MPAAVGQSVETLDSPQLLVDLDVVDANLKRLLHACRARQVAARVHFKSLKCTGLARYIAAAGADGFLAAKLNEAEALVDAGLTDVYIANQIIGAAKLARLAALAQRAQVRVCVDDADNIRHLGAAVQRVGATLGVLVEVDIGMQRCGVEPGEAAVSLARLVADTPGLKFLGLQGYDGHLQMLPDAAARQAQCFAGLEKLVGTARLIEKAGIPVAVITGGGTGTWEFVSSFPGMTEIQPGSFVIMDCAYHAVRPEFGCALSIRATVISRRPGQYVLDAGSKAISRDFGTPVIKGKPEEKVLKLSEEHTRVESADAGIRVGDQREVLPAHCCATMNLHRTCVAVRQGVVEAVWPIEASGRYD